MVARAVQVVPSSVQGEYCTEHIIGLQLLPSPLRPPCCSNRRIFEWLGVNSPPSPVLSIPILQHLLNIANQASLDTSTDYGSGLRKFHLFCDIFSIPERERLPASFALLHSFALWAVTDPDPGDVAFADGTIFETVSVATMNKYLAAVRAWHIAQGWPAPLSDNDHKRLEFSIRGIAKLQGNKRRRPPCPPITLPMLRALRAHLNMKDSFDACVWAMATSAFFGLMRFGEVSVSSRSAYSKDRCLSRGSCLLTVDTDGRPYARLRLPHAKTAKPREYQDVFLVQEAGLCPLEALKNLALVSPAGCDDPLFSWRDKSGHVRPMLKVPALTQINSILTACGYGNAFGHSFRIGGASFYLAKGVPAEIVRLHGRWRSLAYEAYIRAFEQISSSHLADRSVVGLAAPSVPRLV